MAAQSIKEKFKSINQDKISEQARKALQLMKEATDNFKDEDAVSKIRPKFESLFDKIKTAKPDAIRGGVKVTTKPATPTQTKSVRTAASQLSLTAKKRISEAKKERKSQGISTSKSDIEKDSEIKAIKKTGRRVSQGLKANQFGSKSANKGKVYYEYRNNRYDKRPDSKPRLERGGMMAKGGKLESGVYRVGKPTKVSPMLYEQKIVEIFDNGDIATASDYGRKMSDFSGNSYPIISQEQLEAQYKMASGGMMGHGGETHRLYQKKKVRFDDGGALEHDTYEVRLVSTNPKNMSMDGFNGQPLEYYGSSIGEVFEDVMNSIDDDMEIVSIVKK
jgi:hypothetical protein